MTRREVELRYRDAMLGRIWIIVSPFLLLLIYTFVFGFVLKSRWGGSQSTLSFALTLFSGLLLNGILAESLSRAPTIIQANANCSGQPIPDSGLSFSSATAGGSPSLN